MLKGNNLLKEFPCMLWCRFCMVIIGTNQMAQINLLKISNSQIMVHQNEETNTKS